MPEKIRASLERSNLDRSQIETLSKQYFLPCKIRGKVQKRQKVAVTFLFVTLYPTSLTLMVGASTYPILITLMVVFLMAPIVAFWVIRRWRNCQVAVLGKGKSKELIAISPVFKKYTGGQKGAFSFLGILAYISGQVITSYTVRAGGGMLIAGWVATFLLFIAIGIALARRWRPSDVCAFDRADLEFEGDQLIANSHTSRYVIKFQRQRDSDEIHTQLGST